MSSNNSQVLGIPCFGKSIDFQCDLFRQSIAGVGNSISWQFPWVFSGTYLNRCGKFLVSTNPLTFNGICFDKAFPIGNNFISLFFTGSLFLLQAYNFNGQLFRLSPFGGIGGPERTIIFVCFGNLSSLAADSSGQLDIFRHDGNSLGVDGTKVGVFKQTNEISFCSFL